MALEALKSNAWYNQLDNNFVNYQCYIAIYCASHRCHSLEEFLIHQLTWRWIKQTFSKISVIFIFEYQFTWATYNKSYNRFVLGHYSLNTATAGSFRHRTRHGSAICFAFYTRRLRETNSILFAFRKSWIRRHDNAKENAIAGGGGVCSYAFWSAENKDSDATTRHAECMSRLAFFQARHEVNI